jgi:hypothetical protein
MNLIFFPKKIVSYVEKTRKLVLILINPDFLRILLFLLTFYPEPYYSYLDKYNFYIFAIAGGTFNDLVNRQG